MKMVTESVDVAMSRPGIYVAMAPIGCCFCEVDEDGRCFQLRPADFERDGELRPGGWMPGVVFVGPLARQSTEVR